MFLVKTEVVLPVSRQEGGRADDQRWQGLYGRHGPRAHEGGAHGQEGIKVPQHRCGGELAAVQGYVQRRT